MTRAMVRTRPVREVAWGLGLGLLVHVVVTAVFYGLWLADDGCDLKDGTNGVLFLGMFADLIASVVVLIVLERRGIRAGVLIPPVAVGYLLSLAYPLAVGATVWSYTASLMSGCPV